MQTYKNARFPVLRVTQRMGVIHFRVLPTTTPEGASKYYMMYPLASLETYNGRVRFIPFDPQDPISELVSPITKLRMTGMRAVSLGIAPPQWQVFDNNSRPQGVRAIFFFDATRYFVLGIQEGNNMPCILDISKTAGENLIKEMETLEHPVQEYLFSTYSTTVQTGQFTYSSYVVNKQHQPNQVVDMVLQSLNGQLSWDKIITPLDEKSQVLLIVQSMLDPALVVYALGEDYKDIIPKQYLASGQKALDAILAGKGPMQGDPFLLGTGSTYGQPPAPSQPAYPAQPTLPPQPVQAPPAQPMAGLPGQLPQQPMQAPPAQPLPGSTGQVPSMPAPSAPPAGGALPPHIPSPTGTPMQQAYGQSQPPALQPNPQEMQAKLQEFLKGLSGNQ